MTTDFRIITVDASNIDEFGFFCVKNKKHPGYITKRAWLMNRFAEGMRIRLILTHDGHHAGFVEYSPGKYTWRLIYAPDFFVIHCIWVASNKFPYKGMASALIEHCFKDAKKSGAAGVAVVTSNGSWMAGKDLFIKNGFRQVDQAEPHFQLLIKETGTGQLPFFPDNWDERLKHYQGLQLLYTNQCPYIGKAVLDLPQVAEKYGIDLNLVEFTDSNEAREHMVSPYGVFNLVYNGRLLADHPISSTRFENILKKDIKITRKES